MDTEWAYQQYHLSEIGNTSIPNFILGKPVK